MKYYQFKPNWPTYGAATVRERDDSPLAYFVTFSCYGARLHGDVRGSVDRNNNAYSLPFLTAHPKRRLLNERWMKEAPYELDDNHRQIVLRAIIEVCANRGWNLLAAHVRTRHVHSVVEAGHKPEHVVNAFKSYASRALNRSGLDREKRKRWSRHGSTVYLWTPFQVADAIEYVVREQGRPMAVFEKIRPAP